MNQYSLQQTENNELIITKYNYTGIENAIIPEQVDGKKVVAIGQYAFRWIKDIQTVKIPSSIERIGENAFQYEGNLQEVIIEEGLRIIEECAFSECSKLERIILPNSVESIGEYAFGDCISLQEFVIPPRVKEITSQCFNHCESLEKLVIPSSVTVIADDAMDNCDNLKIYTEEGSYACTYAVEKGIPCVIIDSSGNILYEQVEDEEFLKKKQKRMSRITDEELGELKFGSYSWEGKCEFTLYNRTKTVSLSFEDDYKDGITQIQRSSLQWIMDEKNHFNDSLEKEIFLYYQYLLQEEKDTFDEDYLKNLPVVNAQDDMASLIELKDIIIKHHDYMHVILTFNCKWNKEMGMGIEIENNEITVIGYEPDVL